MVRSFSRSHSAIHNSITPRLLRIFSRHRLDVRCFEYTPEEARDRVYALYILRLGSVGALYDDHFLYLFGGYVRCNINSMLILVTSISLFSVVISFRYTR